MATPKTHRKVRLVRSIILSGEHSEKDSIHEVPRAMAERLVGEGSAEFHLEEGEEPETAPTSVNRMAAASNADPVTKQVAPAPAKGAPKK